MNADPDPNPATQINADLDTDTDPDPKPWFFVINILYVWNVDVEFCRLRYFKN